MIDYIIYIPTFQRYDVLFKTTLKMLDDKGVDPTKIILFMKDKEEYEKYEKQSTDLYLYEVVYNDCNNIQDVRNFLREYAYKSKVKYVVQMDDDISDIIDMGKSVIDLDELIQDCFLTALDNNVKYWGVTPYTNPFFLKESVSKNLLYICGAFNGLILEPDDPMIKTEVGHFEDFYFSICHFLRDNGTIRFNNLGIKTKLFGDGGICGSLGGKKNRMKEMEENALTMMTIFGTDIVSITINKWGVGLKLNSHYKLTNGRPIHW